MQLRLRIDRSPSDDATGLVWREPPQDYQAVLEVFEQVAYEDGSSEWKWFPVDVVEEEQRT